MSATEKMDDEAMAIFNEVSKRPFAQQVRLALHNASASLVVTAARVSIFPVVDTQLLPVVVSLLSLSESQPLVVKATLDATRYNDTFSRTRSPIVS
jgi:hypothetical protein